MIKCIYSIPFCIRELQTHYGENSGYRHFLDLLYCTRADSLLTCRRWIEPICNCSTSSDSYFTIPRSYTRIYVSRHRKRMRETERKRKISVWHREKRKVFLFCRTERRLILHSFEHYLSSRVVAQRVE